MNLTIVLVPLLIGVEWDLVDPSLVMDRPTPAMVKPESDSPPIPVPEPSVPGEQRPAPPPAVKKEATVIKCTMWTAKWCLPCQQVKPILETLYREGYTIALADVDKYPESTTSWQITSVPTFVIHRGGQELCRFEGVTTEEKFREWFNSWKVTKGARRAPKQATKPAATTTGYYAPSQAVTCDGDCANCPWQGACGQLIYGFPVYGDTMSFGIPGGFSQGYRVFGGPGGFSSNPYMSRGFSGRGFYSGGFSGGGFSGGGFSGSPCANGRCSR